MSEIKLLIQSTPNPNALKFVVNQPVKTEGNVTYKSPEDCIYNPLAAKIFEQSSFITEIYFFDNYITITQDGSADWDELEQKVRQTILENFSKHDPNFHVEVNQAYQPSSLKNDDPDIQRINSILDETVRPALQMDGGDLQLVNYTGNTLSIFYQGACGSCPSSAMGTLQAIENILRDQFNPDITVELAA